MDRNTLKVIVTDSADALRLAIEKELRSRQAADVARTNRRNADESIIFGFESKEAETAYGKNEMARKARLRIDNVVTYNAHKDAEAAYVVAQADLAIARVNFDEACAVARVFEGVLA
jgi:hypothetical protein